jgi:deoxyribodipyrimidine photo-lyase
MLILFWHRRDLRLADSVGLSKAREISPKVVGVFCLDSDILGRDDIAPVRLNYLLATLEKLQESYSKLGSQLLIIQGQPHQALPQLAQALGAQKVFWHRDVEPYAQKRDRKVETALKNLGIETHTYWDQLLHAPQEIMSQSGEAYKVYTPFWNNWSKQAKANFIPTPQTLEGLNEIEQALAEANGGMPLPPASWDNPLDFPVGEVAAYERLSYFCDRALYEYEEQRNFPSVEGTSQLSPALKFGAIGIRTVWQAVSQAAENARSEEAQASIQAWQKELAWREFYQHCLYFFPELAEGPYRREFQDFPWENNPEHFQAWCEGQTGYPIVDAAMRQLNTTGWMHNRCRMIVASFLTKDLIINWQWGEKYFMQSLIDGDLAANNGGWQWSASSGMDPKPLRIFNPASQAQKFDPEAEYIRYWLPEVRSLETEYLISGKIPTLERHSCGYPAPIVDHKKQQQRFKELYQRQKG